jgi:hypothetical protein
VDPDFLIPGIGVSAYVFNRIRLNPAYTSAIILPLLSLRMDPHKMVLELKSLRRIKGGGN